jgi:redox-sensitive bicupin YhaK (pirin superfamily)
VKAGADGARFLILAAKPLKEPVVQYGPFVMNTREEIEQAIRDYQSGELTKAA